MEALLTAELVPIWDGGKKHGVMLEIQDLEGTFKIHPLKPIRLYDPRWNARNPSPLFQKSLELVSKLREQKETGQYAKQAKRLDHLSNFINVSGIAFKLKIYPAFSGTKCHNNLLCALGGGWHLLEELEIDVELDKVRTLTNIFSCCVFPGLKCVAIEFGAPIFVRAQGVSLKHIYLCVEKVLRESRALEELTIETTGGLHAVGPSLLTFQLPSTLTQLKLDCPLRNPQLRLLSKTNLPKLEWLELRIPIRTVPQALLFQVLANVKSVLTSLTLNCHITSGTRTVLRLPVLEKLKRLQFYPAALPLCSESLEHLDELLPRVESLDLYGITRGHLERWMESNYFERVNELTVSFCDYFTRCPFSTGKVPPVVAMLLQKLPRAMPSIRYLNLTLYFEDLTALETLFLEMGQLRLLKIVIIHAPEVANSNVLDSLFTGISVEALVNSRANPGLLDTFVEEAEGRPSIRNLKDLSWLILESRNWPTSQYMNAGSLMSDTSFKYAFSRMEKLDYVSTWGRFEVSDEVIVQWKEQGKAIDVHFGPCPLPELLKWNAPARSQLDGLTCKQNEWAV